MTNERSLANLRLPKTKKDGHGYQYALPQEKIDELFTYLAEGSSLKKAAKEAKICFETARKYYRKGDEKRGIKPLIFRLTIFQEKISQKYNILLEERRIKMLSTIRGTIDIIEVNSKEKECKCCEGIGTQINKDEIKIDCPACKGEGKKISNLVSKSNLRDLDRLMRLEVFLMGGVTQPEKEKKTLTAEEISG